MRAAMGLRLLTKGKSNIERKLRGNRIPRSYSIYFRSILDRSEEILCLVLEDDLDGLAIDYDYVYALVFTELYSMVPIALNSRVFCISFSS